MNHDDISLQALSAFLCSALSNVHFIPLPVAGHMKETWKRRADCYADVSPFSCQTQRISLPLGRYRHCISRENFSDFLYCVWQQIRNCKGPGRQETVNYSADHWRVYCSPVSVVPWAPYPEQSECDPPPFSFFLLVKCPLSYPCCIHPDTHVVAIALSHVVFSHNETCICSKVHFSFQFPHTLFNSFLKTIETKFVLTITPLLHRFVRSMLLGW